MNGRKRLASVLVAFMLLMLGLSALDGILGAEGKTNSDWPLMTLTGTDSRVTEPDCSLVRSEKEWVKVWKKHKGDKEPGEYNHFYNPLGLPEINFEKCMVIAVFQGSGWNSAGLKTTEIQDEKDRLVFRFLNKFYQPGGTGGGGERVSVYGFFVLPRSNKTVVVEEEFRHLNPSIPPSWKERARFQKVPDRD